MKDATLPGPPGWIALPIHEMNARRGVVEEGLEQVREDIRAAEDRLNGRLDEFARRLPPAR